jgi:hypothetical protein
MTIAAARCRAFCARNNLVPIRPPRTQRLGRETKIISETSQVRDVRLSASWVQAATRPTAVSPHYAAARGSRYR